jgi:hypothetical protein
MEYIAGKEVLSLILSLLLFSHSVFFLYPGVGGRWEGNGRLCEST